MPVNESIAVYDPGNDISCHCEGTVRGKRFVVVSDPKQVASQALATDVLGGNVVVSEVTVAGALAFGVATYDAAATTKVPVMRGHKVVVMTAGAGVTAGASIQSDSQGRAITYAPPTTGDADPLPVVAVLGVALTTAGNAGDDILVALNI